MVEEGDLPFLIDDISLRAEIIDLIRDDDLTDNEVATAILSLCDTACEVMGLR